MKRILTLLAVLVLAIIIGWGLWLFGKGIEADIDTRVSNLLSQGTPADTKLDVNGRHITLYSTGEEAEFAQLRQAVDDLPGARYPRFVKLTDTDLAQRSGQLFQAPRPLTEVVEEAIEPQTDDAEQAAQVAVSERTARYKILVAPSGVSYTGDVPRDLEPSHALRRQFDGVDAGVAANKSDLLAAVISVRGDVATVLARPQEGADLQGFVDGFVRDLPEGTKLGPAVLNASPDRMLTAFAQADVTLSEADKKAILGEPFSTDPLSIVKKDGSVRMQGSVADTADLQSLTSLFPASSVDQLAQASSSKTPNGVVAQLLNRREAVLGLPHVEVSVEQERRALSLSGVYNTDEEFKLTELARTPQSGVRLVRDGDQLDISGGVSDATAWDALGALYPEKTDAVQVSINNVAGARAVSHLQAIQPQLAGFERYSAYATDRGIELDVLPQTQAQRDLAQSLMQHPSVLGPRPTVQFTPSLAFLEAQAAQKARDQAVADAAVQAEAVEAATVAEKQVAMAAPLTPLLLRKSQDAFQISGSLATEDQRDQLTALYPQAQTADLVIGDQSPTPNGLIGQIWNRRQAIDALSDVEVSADEDSGAARIVGTFANAGERAAAQVAMAPDSGVTLRKLGGKLGLSGHVQSRELALDLGKLFAIEAESPEGGASAAIVDSNDGAPGSEIDPNVSTADEGVSMQAPPQPSMLMGLTVKPESDAGSMALAHLQALAPQLDSITSYSAYATDQGVELTLYPRTEAEAEQAAKLMQSPHVLGPKPSLSFEPSAALRQAMFTTQTTAPQSSSDAETATSTQAAEPVNLEPLVSFAANRNRCQRRFAQALKAEKINFETGKTTIDQGSKAFLQRLARLARVCLDGTGLALEIEGHTDSQGSEEANMALSQARAESVHNFLVASGVNDDLISAVGKGETMPIADNETAEGREENRRIEFKVKG